MRGVYGLVILLGACAQDPEILKSSDPCENWLGETYEYYVANSNGGILKLFYQDDRGYHYDLEYSPFRLHFSSTQTHLQLYLVDANPGNLTAYIAKCGVILTEGDCTCTYPIIELEVDL